MENKLWDIDQELSEGDTSSWRHIIQSKATRDRLIQDIALRPQRRNDDIHHLSELMDIDLYG